MGCGLFQVVRERRMFSLCRRYKDEHGMNCYFLLMCKMYKYYLIFRKFINSRHVLRLPKFAFIRGLFLA